MADSDGDYVEDGSDDDFLDHQVTSSRDPSDAQAASSSRRGAASRSKSSSSRRQSKKKGASRAAWEDVKRSWETVVEGDDGALALDLLDENTRRRRLRDTTPLQRGIIRHLVLVLDMSFAMMEKDMLPVNRFRVTMNYARAFVREFFEQNPISQLGIVGMRDGVAVRISDVGGNPAEHLERLKEAEAQEPQGNPSLQNALEMCRGALFHVPSHGTREVLVIYGSLLSSDPGDIHDTIASLVADRIRVSVVGLSAQVAICAELCARTNAGDESTYNVALHEEHFRELFLAATTPPVTRTEEQAPASLLMMGFPSRTMAKRFAHAPSSSAGAGAAGGTATGNTATHGGGISFCACHNKPRRESYLCTRCGTRVCRLPSECPACGLTLILSTHLARSYHHLFPLRNWIEVPWEQARSKACFACLTPFPEAPKSVAAHATTTKITIKIKGKNAPLPTVPENGAAKSTTGKTSTNMATTAAGKRGGTQSQEQKGVSESGRYACEVCGNHFCIDCDLFCHEVIHNCPGCQSDTRGAIAGAEDAMELDGGGESGMNGHTNGTQNGTPSMRMVLD